jgi:hypothetical protein
VSQNILITLPARERASKLAVCKRKYKKCVDLIVRVRYNKDSLIDKIERRRKPLTAYQASSISVGGFRFQKGKPI